jgi:hypothetical protein
MKNKILASKVHRNLGPTQRVGTVLLNKIRLALAIPAVFWIGLWPTSAVALAQGSVRNCSVPI